MYTQGGETTQLTLVENYAKRTIVEISCGSFDQLAKKIGSLIAILGIWGYVIYLWKVLGNYLTKGILHAPKFMKITVAR